MFQHRDWIHRKARVRSKRPNPHHLLENLDRNIFGKEGWWGGPAWEAKVGRKCHHAHERVGRPERQEHSTLAGEVEDLAPCSRRPGEKIRPICLNLRSRIDRNCPDPPIPAVALERWPNRVL